MLVRRGFVNLTHGPRENGHRPAVDPMFRSAASFYRNRVIGVVLSGVLDDGTAGLQAIKMRGGLAIAQHPEDARYSGMPLSAIENVQVDYIAPVSDIATLLTRLANETVQELNNPAPENMEQELDQIEMDLELMEDRKHPGRPSVYACPECGGTLWEIEEGHLIHFRCRVGHAYSAQTLLAEQAETLEESLWVALRALEESAALAHRMANRARERGQNHTTLHFEEQARDAEARAKVIRDTLMNGLTSLKNVKASDE